VSTILIIMAMFHEAAPIVDKLELRVLDNKELGLLGPMVAYQGNIGTGSVYLILNGDTHVYEPTGYVYCSCVAGLIYQESSREGWCESEGEPRWRGTGRSFCLGRHQAIQAGHYIKHWHCWWCSCARSAPKERLLVSTSCAVCEFNMQSLANFLGILIV
jgi:hypothetical protein